MTRDGGKLNGLSPWEHGLTKSLGREKRPLRLEVKRVFGYHILPSDADLLAPHIQAADLIAFDGPAWTSEAEDLLNEVSLGKKTPEQAAALGFKSGEGFLNRLAEIVYGSGKIVCFTDTPLREGNKDHPITKEYLDLENQITSFDEKLRTRPVPFAFPQMVTEYEKVVDAYTASLLKRERYSVEHMERRLARTIKEYPALKAKNPLKLTIFYGAVHSATLAPKLRAKHPASAPYALAANPASFSYATQYFRSRLLGKEVPGELKIRASMEVPIEKFLRSRLMIPKENNQEYPVLLRRIMEAFSPKELEEFYRIYVIEKNMTVAKDFLDKRLQPVLARFEESKK